MPKHKKADRHSSSRRGSRYYFSRESSHNRAHKNRHRRERSRDFSSSDDSYLAKESSTRRSRSKERYREILQDIQQFLADRNGSHNLDKCQVSSPAEVRSAQDVASASSLASVTPHALEQEHEEHTAAQASRGVVPASAEIVSISEENPTSAGNVSFADPPATVVPESQDPEVVPETHALVNELFGEAQAPPTSALWNSVVLNSIQTESRGGLKAEIRTNLLTKYEVKEELAALAPPKLNKEIIAALTPSVMKRDEYQLSSQTQVGACLNAFGTGMSLLLKPEVLQDLRDEAKSALALFAEGIHLLADHHYRLSLARRAFTEPSLNILGKNAAKSAPIDEFLFGKNFAETLKAAQICEKAGREVSKPVPQVGKKTLHPVRQAAQQRGQPQTSRPSGNRKAPARPPAARRSGAHHYQSRRHRSQSRTRSRYHR
ncbi:uncharacterized protein [Temnothorax longispinosus]|uniref:uncharacterized protein n=1 Tax=Temnothorax longispinosus TaxID=300112 RepID=UPI003A993CA3